MSKETTEVQTRIDLRSRGFQSGWLKNIDGSLGMRWYVVTCGWDCACGKGCKFCPANVQAQRDRKRGKIVTVQCLYSQLLKPLSWECGYSVFVAPEGDLFHKAVPTEFIAKVFAVMDYCFWHKFILITKRAERLAKLLTDPRFILMVYEAGREIFGDKYLNRGRHWCDNVLIGVSVEDQDYAHRSLALTELPKQITKIIFVAPMLGPVEFPEVVWRCVGWILCNGERGSKWCKPRPCKLEWQGDLGKQCESHRVPYYLLRRHSAKWIQKLGGKSYRQFPEVLWGR